MCKEWENAFDRDASPNKTSVVSNIFKLSRWFQDVALNNNWETKISQRLLTSLISTGNKYKGTDNKF